MFIPDRVNSLDSISPQHLSLPLVSSVKTKPENDGCDLEDHEGQFCYQNFFLVVFSLWPFKEPGIQLFSLWVFRKRNNEVWILGCPSQPPFTQMAFYGQRERQKNKQRGVMTSWSFPCRHSHHMLLLSFHYPLHLIFFFFFVKKLKRTL